MQRNVFENEPINYFIFQIQTNTQIDISAVSTKPVRDICDKSILNRLHRLVSSDE